MSPVFLLIYLYSFDRVGHDIFTKSAKLSQREDHKNHVLHFIKGIMADHTYFSESKDNDECEIIDVHNKTDTPRKQVFFTYHPLFSRIVVTDEPRVYNTLTNKWIAETVAGKARIGTYKHIRIQGHDYYLHRLVWEAWNGRIVPEGLVVDHIDRNASNSQPNNLRAVTTKVNNENTSRSTKCVHVIWMEKQVVKSYHSMCELRRQTGLKRCTMLKAARDTRNLGHWCSDVVHRGRRTTKTFGGEGTRFQVFIGPKQRYEHMKFMNASVLNNFSNETIIDGEVSNERDFI